MKKKFMLTLLLSSFLLIGCTSRNITNNTIDDTNKDNKSIAVNKETTSNAIPPTQTLVLTDNTTSYSPYLTLGNLIFFPDKENNNRLSTIEEPKSSDFIQQSDIKDIFEYPVESIATINDIIYFSNGSDGNKLYSLDYQRNQVNKINNNYISNLTANLNTLYYINRDNNNKLYFYTIEDSNSGVITNDSFGKFLINGDYIIYQNLSDRSKLYSVKLDGSNKIKLTDVSVDSFVTYNNQIIYINSDDNNTLYIFNPSTSKSTRLNLIHGENLKIHDNKLFIVDKDKSNSFSSLTIDLEGNTATTSVLYDNYINNYFPTSKGIFLDKSPDINKTYILK